MKVLVLGASGIIGQHMRLCVPKCVVAVYTRRNADALHVGLDLCNNGETFHVVEEIQPDVIVNAAAHTAVDKAESEPELAQLLNATAPAALAKAARQLGALLVHYSTDYVFNGEGQLPWQETDATAPLNVYGHTKREGELAIASSGCQHLIFRTSWVYARRGANFAKTMLRLARERERLTVIDDQFGAPTGAELIADVSAQALRQLFALPAAQREPHTGIFHLVAAGQTSWHGYASHVIETAQRLRPESAWRVKEVAPVSSRAFVTAAKRPHNSRLATARLEASFGLRMPPWQDGVERMLAEILSPS
jgi:dTDP-4-dehydrorhamnose reductase